MTPPATSLLSKLRCYPELRYSLVDGGVRIEPPNPGGFTITFRRDGAGWLVAFGDGGVQEHFAGADKALGFVALGLSESCRMREPRTRFVQKATVEVLGEGGWTTIHAVGTPTVAFWRRRREVLLQNRLWTATTSEADSLG